MKRVLPAVLVLAACAPSASPAVPAVVVPPAVPEPAAAPMAPAASAAPAASPPPAAVAAPDAAWTPPTCLPTRLKSKQAPPGKWPAVTALLKGQSVSLRLDARRAGVVVPAYLTGEGQLVLQVGYAMRVPIPDLKVDTQGITGTLSFKQQPFHVRLPWAAVYAAVGVDDEKGWLWVDDVPADQWCK